MKLNNVFTYLGPGGTNSGGAESKPTTRVRKDFPETWLWTEERL